MAATTPIYVEMETFTATFSILNNSSGINWVTILIVIVSILAAIFVVTAVIICCRRRRLLRGPVMMVDERKVVPVPVPLPPPPPSILKTPQMMRRGTLVRKKVVTVDDPSCAMPQPCLQSYQPAMIQAGPALTIGRAFVEPRHHREQIWSTGCAGPTVFNACPKYRPKPQSEECVQWQSPPCTPACSATNLCSTTSLCSAQASQPRVAKWSMADCSEPTYQFRPSTTVKLQPCVEAVYGSGICPRCHKSHGKEVLNDVGQMGSMCGAQEQVIDIYQSVPVGEIRIPAEKLQSVPASNQQLFVGPGGGCNMQYSMSNDNMQNSYGQINTLPMQVQFDSSGQIYSGLQGGNNGRGYSLALIPN